MNKILLVDDDTDIVHTTKMILEEEGYEVVGFSCGNNCLDSIIKEKPGLVLLDVMMPECDGWEICKLIKEDTETSHIPVVMFTVRASKDDVYKSLIYSKADYHIDKPFTKDELLNTVEQFLKK